jgi:hypothetical protein
MQRRFPASSISASGLWKLYKKHQISWKCMRTGYPHDAKKLAEIDEKRGESFRSLIGAVTAGSKVLYCDEISFSPYSTRAKTWAPKG